MELRELDGPRLVSTERVPTLRELFRQGLGRAARSLSEMVGREIAAQDGRLEVLSLAEAAALAGPPERATVGVYVGLTGRIRAHVVLLFTPADARRLLELLLQHTYGGTDRFEALARPALAEVGNVMGSSFAIVLGDLLGAPIWSTAPIVQVDMARALVDGLLASASHHESQVLVGMTHFAQLDTEPQLSVRGTFLFVPEPDALTALVEAIEQSR